MASGERLADEEEEEGSLIQDFKEVRPTRCPVEPAHSGHLVGTWMRRRRGGGGGERLFKDLKWKTNLLSRGIRQASALGLEGEV